jgi:hypothetical protein
MSGVALPRSAWFRKIKSRKYPEALKTRFAADWEQYAEQVLPRNEQSFVSAVIAAVRAETASDSLEKFSNDELVAPASKEEEAQAHTCNYLLCVCG